MAISGERKKYTEELGAKFNIAAFHDEVLKDGCVPLNILHGKMAGVGKDAEIEIKRLMTNENGPQSRAISF